MTPRAPRVAPKMRLPAEDMLESDFQQRVVKIAHDYGWGISPVAQRSLNAELAAYGQSPPPLDGLVFHTRIMYRSEPGWPDLTLIRLRDRRLIFAELKREDGKLTPRQAEVLDLLRCLEYETSPIVTSAYGGRIGDFTGPTIQVFVWRPSDLPTIHEVLR